MVMNLPNQFIASSVFVLLMAGCQPASSGDSASKGEPTPVQGTTETATVTDTSSASDTGTGTGSGTGTGTGSGAGSGSGTGTGTGSGTGTDPGPQKLTLSGTVKFLLPDQNGFFQDTVVPGATVFLEGFPDQGVTTDSNGAFTVLLDVPSGAGLTAGEYRVVAWKIAGAVKYGAAKTATPVVNVPYDVGEIKIGHTAEKRFVPKDKVTTNNVDKSTCSGTIKGYEGKAAISFSSFELRVDYLPEGTYDYTLNCATYLPFNGSFTVDPIDQNQVSGPNWSEALPRPELEQ